ncbi:MAG: zf-HC2 domain-containing protein, partial [Actinobacteria bacterium]|nr:zf-HC2 domain-containing protein [Actinomycetota bacterium]
MGGELNHAEIIDLLGAYALDAVDPEESAAIIAHLRECLVCLQEVVEHREVASFLAPAESPAPARLWDQIAGSLEEAPPPLQLSNVTRIDSDRRTSGWSGRMSAIAAAAVAVAAIAIVAVLG